ncbi:MAG TPA: hypothetical protein PKY10_00040 [Lentisphaeria bacterium]|nr:hypothetical protein [Lentisphaeria bacterium]
MSGYGHIVDLDELVLRCRDEKAREYIREAVACYKAGAFRSAIVATWIAVVFDFLHKLGELELTGDKNAEQHLNKFKAIVAGGKGKLKEALDFEREILNIAANEFELLTPNEQLDLERLQEDRNRCAHPSMQALDTIYEPTAELARAHIRNAVDILLAREPVQGKAAFERICSEVKSDYFPITTAEAVEHFRNGPLVRARDSLIRSLVLGFIKAFVLDDTIKYPENRRLAAALGAVIELHRARTERVLQDELPKMLSSIPDERFVYIIYLAGFCPLVWETAGDNVRSKAKRYLESDNLTEKELLWAVIGALHITDLEDAATTNALRLDNERLSKLLHKGELLPKFRCLVPRLIANAHHVSSYRGAEKYFEMLILPIAPILTPDELHQILEAVVGNGQAYDAGGMPEILGQLFDQTESIRDACKPHWQDFCDKLKGCPVSIDYDCLHDRLREAGILEPATEGSTP